MSEQRHEQAAQGMRKARLRDIGRVYVTSLWCFRRPSSVTKKEKKRPWRPGITDWLSAVIVTVALYVGTLYISSDGRLVLSIRSRRRTVCLFGGMAVMPVLLIMLALGIFAAQIITKEQLGTVIEVLKWALYGVVGVPIAVFLVKQAVMRLRGGTRKLPDGTKTAEQEPSSHALHVTGLISRGDAGSGFSALRELKELITELGKTNDITATARWVGLLSMYRRAGFLVAKDNTSMTSPKVVRLRERQQ